mmetsp:Transcript_5725/g.14566  ORF Transcript_5725/g.14566 Transcript_5725/m.14566 type:complete len:216 (-) Transcript_5725:93-740(-)
MLSELDQNFVQKRAHGPYLLPWACRNLSDPLHEPLALLSFPSVQRRLGGAALPHRPGLAASHLGYRSSCALRLESVGCDHVTRSSAMNDQSTPRSVSRQCICNSSSIDASDSSSPTLSASNPLSASERVCATCSQLLSEPPSADTRSARISLPTTESANSPMSSFTWYTAAPSLHSCAETSPLNQPSSSKSTSTRSPSANAGVGAASAASSACPI